MIQRIQTLYLLVVAALLAVTIFTPMAYFSIGGEEYTLTAFAVRNAEGVAVQPTLYMGILLAMAGILPLIVIFLYKHRMLQLRLCIVEIVLLVGQRGDDRHILLSLGALLFTDRPCREGRACRYCPAACSDSICRACHKGNFQGRDARAFSEPHQIA